MKYIVIRCRWLSGCMTAGIFVLGLTISTFAQGGPPPGTGPPSTINPRGDDLIRQNNEARLRRPEIEASAESKNQQKIQAAITNIRQDFTRIQVLRNDIARNLVAHKPLDHNLITEQTAEINKHAQRLKVYMLSQAPEKKEQVDPSDLKSEEMIDALVKLCKLIDSFTENPALKDAATIGAKDGDNAKKEKAKADEDLLAIIELSDSIHKKSDSLKVPK
ncbi:MAG TPA: hypothetical protein VKC61_16955 [Pyrinomonadaceae bacterium]|nr:hypothetical protein [Pyrinomonadaceae bacterium]